MASEVDASVLMTVVVSQAGKKVTKKPNERVRTNKLLASVPREMKRGGVVSSPDQAGDGTAKRSPMSPGNPESLSNN